MNFVLYPHDTQECRMQIESRKLLALLCLLHGGCGRLRQKPSYCQRKAGLIPPGAAALPSASLGFRVPLMRSNNKHKASAFV